MTGYIIIFFPFHVCIRKKIETYMHGLIILEISLRISGLNFPPRPAKKIFIKNATRA